MNKPKNFEELIARLPGAKQHGDHWKAPCPLPGHKTPEGHITLRDAGDKALITCQGGRHSYQDICQSIGFDGLTYSRNGNGHKIIATYDYSTPEGKLLYQVVRFEPKGFRQRRPDGNGGWLWNLNGIEPTLYHQDRLPQAIQNELQVINVEGEKDVDRLWNSGKVATCNPMGAGKWRDSYSEALRGADLIVIPDNDQPGYEHAVKVAQSCLGIAKRVRILELPNAKDISDWLDNGGDIDELEGLIENSKDFDPLLSNLNMYVYIRTQQAEVEANRNKNTTENATSQRSMNEKTQQEPLSKRVADWITTTSGWFDTLELDRDLGLLSTADKNNRREVMLRLATKGIVEKHQKINKQFRYVNTKVTNLEFKTASNAGVLPIKWPLGIERYVNLFPGNMAVVAGSPNAGKTAMLLNFIYLNQDNFPIYYFCSEMGAVELHDRLDKFPDMDIKDWHFEAIERASDFADVIKPDCVNIIDYLEMTVELYTVNTHLIAISHKLGSGLAIVALQKKQGATFGRGQEFGLEKPKLYLSMDKGKLQIVKGKSWATKNVDPNGLQVSLKITDGCQFQATGEWDWR